MDKKEPDAELLKTAIELLQECKDMYGVYPCKHRWTWEQCFDEQIKVIEKATRKKITEVVT